MLIMLYVRAEREGEFGLYRGQRRILKVKGQHSVSPQGPTMVRPGGEGILNFGGPRVQEMVFPACFYRFYSTLRG